MNFKQATFLTFSLVLFHYVAIGNDPISSNDYIGKTFWLKHPLIFLNKDSLPKIYSNDIIFTDQCRVDPYAGKILRRGTEIKITSLVSQIEFTTVSFNVGNDIYSVEVYGNKGNRFRKSFNGIFAAKNKETEIPCAEVMKTKKQVIACMGYPISSCKEGEIEKLFYILEFAASSSSYDGWWVAIQKGKVIGISGYI